MRYRGPASSRLHALSSTTAAFRRSPLHFARFICDFRNAARNSSCDIESTSLANDRDQCWPVCSRIAWCSITECRRVRSSLHPLRRLGAISAPVAISMACGRINAVAQSERSISIGPPRRRATPRGKTVPPRSARAGPACPQSSKRRCCQRRAPPRAAAA